jgi:hypothetical protein
MKNYVRAFLRLSLGLVLVAGLLACGAVKKLEQFKQHDARGDFAWIAAQNVDCQAAQEGCNQLHLLKGKACFRLAKEEEAANKKAEAKAHYTCAADEIEAGMAQTTNFDAVTGARAQWYENLCESLRNWLNMEADAEVLRLANKLLETAKKFRAEEAEHPAAIYFANSAQFTLLRKDVLANAPTVCENLKKIIDDLDRNLARAGERYTPNFRQLRSDVAGVKPQGCQ